MNIFDRIDNGIRGAESSLVNLLSAIAPWGAPLAPAFMSYGGMVKHLSFTPTVALIIAGVIEILGLATVHTTLLFWRHNRRYTSEVKREPTQLAAGMFGLYLVIILTVNVLLEWPYQWIYMPIIARALLSLLSVPAAITLAIRAQHTELLSEIDAAKVERKKEIAARKVTETSIAEQKVTGKFPLDWRKLPAEDRAMIGGMTTAEIMAHYDVSERTATNWRAYAKNG